MIMGKLKLLDEKQQFKSELIDILLDKASVNRYKTLADYCEANKLNLDEEELKQFIKKVEKTIYDQVVYYAHLMYHYMETSGDWGEPGEQQVKITFCRNLLKVDPKVHLDADHAAKFNEKVKETIQKLKINTLSAEVAKQQLRQYKFKLFGKEFETFKALELDRYLKFSGSNKFLHARQYGAQMEFIMGSGKHKDYHGYHVTFVQKEYIRTPNNVMSMAAIIGRQNIYIRLESLNHICSEMASNF